MVRNLFEPPDVECPACGRQEFRWIDGSADTRLKLLASRLWLRLARRLLDLRMWCDTCRRYFRVPHALPRTVVGYHGCDRTFAADLATGRKSIRDWRFSSREFEWLGEGIYFWEHAPGRAWQWAQEHHPGQEAVVAVEIRLGKCLDLGDTVFAPLLVLAYNDVVRLFEAQGTDLPKNSGGKEKKARRLDCLVLNRLMQMLGSEPGALFQTIRSPFEEGVQAYPGAMLRVQSHVQIAVRDRACIVPAHSPRAEEGNQMSKEQLLRQCLERMARYNQKYTLKEQFQHLVDRGVIDKDGKVLLYCGEEEDGLEASNGQANNDENQPDTPS